MRQFLYLLFALAQFTSRGTAQVVLDSTELDIRIVAQNLSVPWEILWGPDDKIWFTERPGRVSRVDPATGTVEQLLTISEVVAQGESGLLGMVLHPNFTHPDSQFVYLAYTYNAPGRTERLVRYTYSDDKLVSPLILLDNIPAANTHNGSRLVISPDRKIFMSTGDAQNTALSQNTSSLAGKILRLNLDGSIPADNPFPGNPVWSYGHRNPQGLVLAPNGILYSSEHGPNTDDELNIIQRGRNFGWPSVNGFCNLPAEQTFCAANNVAEPIMAWTPTLAVAGLDYYDHPSIPEWRHALLMTTLKEDDLRVLRLNTEGDAVLSESIHFNNSFGRLRDVCVGPDGAVYLATSNRDGRANNGFPVAEDDRIIQLVNLSYTTPVTGLSERRPVFYPNPAGNTLHLHVAGGQKIRLFDLHMRLLMNETYLTSLDISQLPSGMYWLEVQTDTGIVREKLIRH